MFSRSQILSSAGVLVLASWSWAQTQPPTGSSSQTPPGGSVTGAPPETMGNPGAIPQDQPSDPYGVDKDFVKSAAESSATEVHLGKLAQDKGSTDAVKELGKQMVEAHTQTAQQLKEAAAALKVQSPAEPPRKAKKAEEKLAKLSGPDFDRAYAKLAADEEKQAVKQFEREAKNGKVAGLKDFATKSLPDAQERQKKSEELASAGTGTASRQK